MAHDVVGVRVAAVLVVRRHHVRPEAADQPHQRLGGLLDRDEREAALGQRRQRVALGQAGVDEAEPVLLDAEDLAGPVHLLAADLGRCSQHVGAVHLRVEDRAALAAGAGGDHDVDPSATYFAVVAAPLLDSSSGWAWTAISRNWSGSVTRSLSPDAAGAAPGRRPRRDGPGRATRTGEVCSRSLARSGTVPDLRTAPAAASASVHRPPSPVLAWPDRPRPVPFGGRPPESQEYPHVSTPTDEQAQGVWLTQEAYDRLKAELDQLVAGRPAMSAEINARREEGDLKENGGYHAAKDEQGKQEARIRQLTDLLRKAHGRRAADDGDQRRDRHRHHRQVRRGRRDREVPARLARDRRAPRI